MCDAPFDVAKKCYQIGQKVAKMAKICQSGEKSSKWQKVTKVAKSPQIMLQGVSRVPDGSRSQTARARTTQGTYAWAPYAFAALGQGPKGPELVIYTLRILL